LRLSRVSHSLVSFEMVMVVLSCVFVICHSSCAALAINASTCDTVYLYLVAGCLNGLLQKKCGSSLRVGDIIALRVKSCLYADSRCWRVEWSTYRIGCLTTYMARAKHRAVTTFKT
jgi:hypothetical protein